MDTIENHKDYFAIPEFILFLLSSVPGIGGITVSKIHRIAKMRSVPLQDVLTLSEYDLKHTFTLSEKIIVKIVSTVNDPSYYISIYSDLERNGIHTVLLDSPDFPEKIRSYIPRPPALVYLYGNEKLLYKHATALAASRNIPDDKLEAAFRIGTQIHSVTGTLIRGNGIDLHEVSGTAASKSSGNVITVLNCGMLNYIRSAKKPGRSADSLVINDLLPSDRALAISWYNPLQKWSVRAERDRNSFIFAFAGKIIAFNIAENGTMETNCLKCIRDGKPVFTDSGKEFHTPKFANKKLIQAGGIPVRWDPEAVNLSFAARYDKIQPKTEKRAWNIPSYVLDSAVKKGIELSGISKETVLTAADPWCSDAGIIRYFHENNTFPKAEYYGYDPSPAWQDIWIERRLFRSFGLFCTNALKNNSSIGLHRNSFDLICCSLPYVVNTVIKPFIHYFETIFRGAPERIINSMPSGILPELAYYFRFLNKDIKSETSSILSIPQLFHELENKRSKPARFAYLRKQMENYFSRGKTENKDLFSVTASTFTDILSPETVPVIRIAELLKPGGTALLFADTRTKNIIHAVNKHPGIMYNLIIVAETGLPIKYSKRRFYFGSELLIIRKENQ